MAPGTGQPLDVSGERPAGRNQSALLRGHRGSRAGTKLPVQTNEVTSLRCIAADNFWPAPARASMQAGTDLAILTRHAAACCTWVGFAQNVGISRWEALLP